MDLYCLSPPIASPVRQVAQVATRQMPRRVDIVEIGIKRKSRTPVPPPSLSLSHVYNDDTWHDSPSHSEKLHHTFLPFPPIPLYRERESWITVVEIISDSERRNVFQRKTFAVKDDCRWTKRRSFYSDGLVFVFQPNAICFLVVVVENKIRNCTMASWNNKTHTKKYRDDE